MNDKPELKSVYPSKLYCLHEHPFAYANITKCGETGCLLQIYSDYGVFAYYWSSTGKDAPETFILGCDGSYIRTKLQWWLNMMQIKKSSTSLDGFMENCWSRLKEHIRKEYENNRNNG